MRLEILKPQVNIAQSRLGHDPWNLFNVIIAGLLTPKIPWNQKLVDCYLGSLCEEKWILNFIFILDKW
jgi:hypothetical protein